MNSLTVNIDGKSVVLSYRGNNQKGDKAIFKYENKATGDYFTKYVPLETLNVPAPTPTVAAVPPKTRTKAAKAAKAAPTPAPAAVPSDPAQSALMAKAAAFKALFPNKSDAQIQALVALLG